MHEWLKREDCQQSMEVNELKGLTGTDSNTHYPREDLIAVHCCLKGLNDSETHRVREKSKAGLAANTRHTLEDVIDFYEWTKHLNKGEAIKDRWQNSREGRTVVD